MTDKELIVQCQKGSRRAQKALYDRFSPTLYSTCLRYCRNEADAQDALQEGFTRVFKNLDRYNYSGSLEGWMRRIVINCSLTLIKKRNKHLAVEAKDYMAADLRPSPIDDMGAEEIHELVRSLPDGYRTVFNLNVVEGYSHKEIAEMLGCGESTSRTQLLKARRMLQALLSTRNEYVHATV